jgi:hypothetical protein
MIRLVFLLRRRADVSAEDFQAYWSEQHAPLVDSHRSDLGIQRYIQSYRIDDPRAELMASSRGGMEQPYDGVAELWYTSEQAMFDIGKSSVGIRAGRALLDDERQFIDLTQSPLWVAHEHPPLGSASEVVVARPSSGIVKLHYPIRQRPEVNVDMTRQHPLDDASSMVGALSSCGVLDHRWVCRFESPIEAALREERGTVVDAYLGHFEAWLDLSSPPVADDGQGIESRIAAIEATVVDFARSTFWFGQERVIISS